MSENENPGMVFVRNEDGSVREYHSLEEMLKDREERRTLWDKITLRFHWWFLNPIRNLGWWFVYRLHPRHRYHVVRTGLAPSYYDTDTRMEAAIIRLFLDYIEIEKPFEWFDTEGSHNAENWRRIKELYAYFKGIDILNPWYQKTRHQTPKDWNNPESLAAWDLVCKVRKDAYTQRICEVVRLRGHYWT